MKRRASIYTGCMWLIVAAFLGFWTLFAFAWGGPATGLIFAAIDATCLAMAAGLWMGRGGRSLILVSTALGGALAVLGVVGVAFADPSAAVSNAVLALLGVAILLASLFLLGAQAETG